jgi:phage terminase large subunit
MVSAKISVIPEFLEKIEILNAEEYFTINKTEIVNNANDSTVLFKGIKTSSGEQTASLKSLQGVTTWVLDEAEELTEETTFDKIDLSIRTKGVQNRVIIILNPTTKEHWIYKRFFESVGVPEGFNGIKNNVTYIHTTYEDNIKNLDQSFIDRVLEIKRTNPQKYKHQILGGWLNKAEGVVFENWSIGEFEYTGQVIYGQDYGFNPDPTTLIRVSIDSRRKKIYVEECFYKTGLSTAQIVEQNKEHCKGALIIADSAEPRLINDIKNRGVNIRACTKGKDSIKAGINLMLEYEIIVSPESTNIIKELNNYTYSDKKSQTAIDDYNHAIDAMRYAVYHQLRKPNKVGLRQRN